MTTSQSRQVVAGEVRAAIARAGLRQSDLAPLIGISRQALSRKLRGEAPLSVDEVIAIARALGVDAGSLIAPATTAA